MTRDPGSRWAGLPEAGAPDGRPKTQFIVHSTGTLASAANNAAYFGRYDIEVESTFIIGQTPDDPTLQLMDSTDRADANGSANGRAVSVEVVGRAGDPFTPHQRSELIRIGRWAADEHPIELRVIPSEAASGFGWHVMFGAPGPWTSVVGKECPGGRRIHELKHEIFPAIFNPPPREEPDVQFTDMLPNANPDSKATGKHHQTLSDWAQDVQANSHAAARIASQMQGTIVRQQATIDGLSRLIAHWASLDLETIQRTINDAITKSLADGIDVDLSVSAGA